MVKLESHIPKFQDIAKLIMSTDNLTDPTTVRNVKAIGRPMSHSGGHEVFETFIVDFLPLQLLLQILKQIKKGSTKF